MLQIEKAHHIQYGGVKCSRASMERKRLLNAKTTASRHRKWQEVKLEREESERREALEILELRRKERARLAEYIHRAVQNPAKPKKQRNGNKQETGGHKKPRWNSSALVEDRETDAVRIVAKTPSSNNVHGGRIHIADRLFLLRQAHDLRTTTSTPPSGERMESFGSDGQPPEADTVEDCDDCWAESACDTYPRNLNISCGTIDYSNLDLDDDGYFMHRQSQQVTKVCEDMLMMESSVTTGYVAGNLTAYPGSFAPPKVLNREFAKTGCAEVHKRNPAGISCGKKLKREDFFDTEATSVLESSQQVFVSRSTSPSISVANSGTEMACNCSSPQEDHRSPTSTTQVPDLPNTSYNRDGSSLRDEIVKARLANEAATARLIAEVTAIQSRLEDCNHPEPLDFEDEIVRKKTSTRPDVFHPAPTTQGGESHNAHVSLEECTCSHEADQGTIQVHNRAMLSDTCNTEPPRFNSAVAALTAYCVSPSDEQGYKRAKGAQGQIKIMRGVIQNWIPSHEKLVNDNSKIQEENNTSHQISGGETPSGDTKPPAYAAWEIGWESQSHVQQLHPHTGYPPDHFAPCATNIPATINNKFQLNDFQTNDVEYNTLRQAEEAEISAPGKIQQPPHPPRIHLTSGTVFDTWKNPHPKHDHSHRPSDANYEDSVESFKVHQMRLVKEFQPPPQPFNERMRHTLEDQHLKNPRELRTQQQTHQKNEDCFPRSPVGFKAIPGMQMAGNNRQPIPKQIPSFTNQDSRPSTALPPREHCLAPQMERSKMLPGKKETSAGSGTLLSEEERNILASLEKLDIKLAAVSARISKSACNSIISDGGANSIRSAPTVMAPPSTFPGSSLMSLGSRPRKCCVMNPPSPLTPQAPRPYRGAQRRMVGLTNNCRQNSQTPVFSREAALSRRSPMINPRNGGDILLHQFPHQCFDNISRPRR